MKTSQLAAALLMTLTLLPTPGFASSIPLLERLTTPGYTRPEFTTTEDCRIFSDHVQIVHGAGELRAIEVKKVSVETSTVLRMIEAAEKGNVKRTPAPTDLPTTRYLAFKNSPHRNALKQIPLKSTGSEILSNEAAEAISLLNLIDALCK